jgi:hypothetical protein
VIAIHLTQTTGSCRSLDLRETDRDVVWFLPSVVSRRLATGKYNFPYRHERSHLTVLCDIFVEGELLRDHHSVRTKLFRAANREGTKTYFCKIVNVNSTTANEAVT